MNFGQPKNNAKIIRKEVLRRECIYSHPLSGFYRSALKHIDLHPIEICFLSRVYTRQNDLLLQKVAS
jgi:hypothetical protein